MSEGETYRVEIQNEPGAPFRQKGGTHSTLIAAEECARRLMGESGPGSEARIYCDDERHGLIGWEGGLSDRCMFLRWDGDVIEALD